jgi:hypothetical protein
MLSKLATFYGILLLASSGFTPSTQTARTPSPVNSEPQAQKPVETRIAQFSPQQEKALHILEQLTIQAKVLDEMDHSIVIQAQIADLLWEYNEQAARHLFTEAFQTINNLSDDSVSQFAIDQKTSMRVRLIRKIANRDAKLAEKFIKSITEYRSLQTHLYTDPTPEERKSRAVVSLTLANHLAHDSPEEAARMIRHGFSGGLTKELVMALKLVREKAPALADRLTGQALIEIPPNPDEPLGDLMNILLYIGSGEKSKGQTPDHQPVRSQTLAEAIGPSLIKPLLDFAFKALNLHMKSEQNKTSGARRKRMITFDLMDQSIVAGLLPLFEQHQPERVAFVRARLKQIDAVVSDRVRVQSNAPRPTTVQGLVDAAQTKNEPLERDLLFKEAARRAEADGNFDQAISIAERISDKSRSSDISSFRYAAAQKALDRGEIDAAHSYAVKSTDIWQRIRILCRIAEKAFENSDLQRASSLLSEAENLIAMTSTGFERLSSHLTFTATAAKIDTTRGFAAMGASIRAINDAFPIQSVRNGVGTRTDTFEAEFDQTLMVLARKDLLRSLRLAQGVMRTEISLYAQLSVCRGVLTEKRKPK